MNFMKKTLDIPAMAVLALGFALPSLGGMVYDKVAAMAPASVVNAVGGRYTKPIVLATTSAGLIYLASRYGMVTNATAATAALVSTFLFAASAVKDSGILSNIPMIGPSLEANIPSLNGIGGGNFGGYSGGYLGYLGNDQGPSEMLDAPVEAQLYGMGSSPQVNIF